MSKSIEEEGCELKIIENGDMSEILYMPASFVDISNETIEKLLEKAGATALVEMTGIRVTYFKPRVIPISTLHQAKVLKVLKGDLKEGDTIQIKAFGGYDPISKVWKHIHRTPMFLKEERLLLFLNIMNWEDYEKALGVKLPKNTYYNRPAFYGFYEIEGKFYSLDFRIPMLSYTLPEQLKVSGLTLGDFIKIYINN